jgi:hypothetical protein
MSDVMTTDRVCVSACTSQIQGAPVTAGDGKRPASPTSCQPWLVVTGPFYRRSLRIAGRFELTAPLTSRRYGLIPGRSCSSRTLA